MENLFQLFMKPIGQLKSIVIFRNFAKTIRHLYILILWSFANVAPLSANHCVEQNTVDKILAVPYQRQCHGLKELHLFYVNKAKH